MKLLIILPTFLAIVSALPVSKVPVHNGHEHALSTRSYRSGPTYGDYEEEINSFERLAAESPPPRERVSLSYKPPPPQKKPSGGSPKKKPPPEKKPSGESSKRKPPPEIKHSEESSMRKPLPHGVTWDSSRNSWSNYNPVLIQGPQGPIKAYISRKGLLRDRYGVYYKSDGSVATKEESG